jgi:TolA-binding protein
MTTTWLQSLGRSLAAEQDALLSRQDLSAVERRVIEHEAVTRRHTGTRRWTWALAAVAMASAGLGVGYWRTHRPLSFEVDQAARFASDNAGIGTWVSAPETEAVPVRFSDGTRVVLAAGARARITQVDRQGVGIVVERGRLGFGVVHREATRWSIATGPFAVTVTGTEFDLGWQPETETLEVAVRQGSVVVTGCQFGGGRPVGANEVLRTRCGDTLSLTTTRRAEPEGSAESAAPSAQALVEPGSATVDRSPRGSEPAAATAPTWQVMARGGHYRTAFDLASRAGFENECARVTASELALLMDVARYAGHVDRAEQAARTLRSRFAGKPQAALAAFTLGRIAFDRASDYGDAARWFRVYLSEQPAGALAREAEGRLMESLARSGQASQARQVAREYLQRYPEGPHARVARQLIGS